VHTKEAGSSSASVAEVTDGPSDQAHPGAFQAACASENSHRCVEWYHPHNQYAHRNSMLLQLSPQARMIRKVNFRGAVAGTL
jgi:hypothetical protein